MLEEVIYTGNRTLGCRHQGVFVKQQADIEQAWPEDQGLMFGLWSRELGKGRISSLPCFLLWVQRMA